MRSSLLHKVSRKSRRKLWKRPVGKVVYTVALIAAAVMTIKWGNELAPHIFLDF